jgi:DNA-binding CsgD family transcriptional regulator
METGTMEAQPLHAVLWQILAPGDHAREAVEALLREHGYQVIQEGVVPFDAPISLVRSAISITRREHEVLTALLNHDHTVAMADSLGISRSTVEWHLGNLMRCCGVSSRHRLLAGALLSGALEATQNPWQENR